jgi:hypothetical protein
VVDISSLASMTDVVLKFNNFFLRASTCRCSLSL